MTRPFSTWQLREGWANLHSASDREQVPLWNSRHTSRVSHLVSRPMVMLTAIGVTHQHWAAVETDGRKTVWWEQGWLIVMWQKVPSKKKKNTQRKQKQKYFSSAQTGSEFFRLVYFRGYLLVLLGKSGSWSFSGVRQRGGEQRPALTRRKKKTETTLRTSSLWHASICHRASVPSPESTEAHRK